MMYIVIMASIIGWSEVKQLDFSHAIKNLRTIIGNVKTTEQNINKCEMWLKYCHNRYSVSKLYYANSVFIITRAYRSGCCAYYQFEVIAYNLESGLDYTDFVNYTECRYKAFVDKVYINNNDNHKIVVKGITDFSDYNYEYSYDRQKYKYFVRTVLLRDNGLCGFGITQKTLFHTDIDNFNLDDNKIIIDKYLYDFDKLIN